jgi:HEAT repeat protein
LDEKSNPVSLLTGAAGRGGVVGPSGYLTSKDPAVRWWGALEMVSRGERVESSLGALVHALDDDSPDVRVAIAEALAGAGHDDEALPVLTKSLEHESPFIRLAALGVLSRMGARAAPAIPAIRQAKMKSAEHPDAAEYVGRMVGYLPDRIRAAAEKAAAGN